LTEIAGNKAEKQPFKHYPIGYLHLAIAEVRTEQGKLYLFVAVDRTSKYAFAQLQTPGQCNRRRLPSRLDRLRPLQDPHRANR
jgi:hypothetical protein